MPQHEDLAGWTFKVEEVSAGVYRVHGVDEEGRSLQATGTDPNALLEEGKRNAAQVMKGTSGRSGE